MGLRLLLDEDSQARALIKLLRATGHDVATVAESGLSAKDDSSVLRFAAEQGRILLTRNPSDFLDLHNADSDHGGILAIYQGGNSRKNMTYPDIARALANLESSDIDPAGHFVVLNAWRS